MRTRGLKKNVSQKEKANQPKKKGTFPIPDYAQSSFLRCLRLRRGGPWPSSSVVVAVVVQWPLSSPAVVVICLRLPSPRNGNVHK